VKLRYLLPADHRESLWGLDVRGCSQAPDGLLGAFDHRGGVAVCPGPSESAFTPGQYSSTVGLCGFVSRLALDAASAMPVTIMMLPPGPGRSESQAG